MEGRACHEHLPEKGEELIQNWVGERELLGPVPNNKHKQGEREMSEDNKEMKSNNDESEKEVKYNKEWIEYYQYLESLRQSGVVNMYGAGPYLEKAAGIDSYEALDVMASWMENYEDLVADGICVRGE